MDPSQWKQFVKFLGRVWVMKKEEKKQTGKDKKKKTEKPLPKCTTAPSAEHARAKNEDEPCDDFRAGE